MVEFVEYAPPTLLGSEVGGAPAGWPVHGRAGCHHRHRPVCSPLPASTAPIAVIIVRYSAERAPEHSRVLRARHQHRHIAARRRSIAELPGGVVSPAVGRPASRESAGADPAYACAERREAQPTRDQHRHTAVRCRPVSELPGCSPAVGRPAGREPAGVGSSPIQVPGPTGTERTADWSSAARH